MSAILTPILEIWGSARERAPAHVLDHYIAHPDSVQCVVAVDGAGRMMGFQSLKVAAAGNTYDLPAGWSIIGTYVDLNNARNGVGRALFNSTSKAARVAGLTRIDATIGAQSVDALAYYDAMGFRTYRQLPGAVGKVVELACWRLPPSDNCQVGLARLYRDRQMGQVWPGGKQCL